MSVLLFLLCSACLLFETQPFTDRVRVLDPVCEFCKYSLRGLPDHGRCPECGEFYSNPWRRVRQVEKLVFRRGVWRFWLFALAAVILYESTGLGACVFAHRVIQSYLDDGYPIEVATNAAFKRELSNGGEVVGQVLGGLWLGASPLLGLVATGLRRYVLLVGGAVVALFLVSLSGPGA